MAHKTWSIIFGILLILGGGLVFLQQAGYIESAWSVFWSVIIIASGLVFLAVYARNRRHWWALIPGLTLLGMGIVTILPDDLMALGGALFLGALAIAFWLIYAFDRGQWWAIIPAGVMTTMAVAAYLIFSKTTALFGVVIDAWVLGGIFFTGLALTFLFVAIFPKPQGMMKWAFIPALVLFIIAIVTVTLKLQNIMLFVWPIVFLGAGIYLIYLYFQNK